MDTKKYDIIGIGSPIIDLLAQVSEEFIDEINGEKGGMVLVDSPTMDSILSRIDKKSIKRSSGGAAANTTFVASHLGLKSAFLGKLGVDENAIFYKDAFTKAGGSLKAFKTSNTQPTARCLSLITPDAERTMRTHLGAASELVPKDIDAQEFSYCRHVHIEGYLLFQQDLLETTLRKIKEYGATISLDLGSFEVVGASKKILPNILSEYIDIVFANEEEAEALYNTGNHKDNLKKLSELCDIAVVKLGRDGALIKQGNTITTIAPEFANARIDTTGAGDIWAAGFLYSYLSGKDIPLSGKVASYMGARAVEKMGTTFTKQEWITIKNSLASFS